MGDLRGVVLDLLWSRSQAVSAVAPHRELCARVGYFRSIAHNVLYLHRCIRDCSALSFRVDFAPVLSFSRNRLLTECGFHGLAVDFSSLVTAAPWTPRGRWSRLRRSRWPSSSTSALCRVVAVLHTSPQAVGSIFSSVTCFCLQPTNCQISSTCIRSQWRLTIVSFRKSEHASPSSTSSFRTVCLPAPVILTVECLSNPQSFTA